MSANIKRPSMAKLLPEKIVGEMHIQHIEISKKEAEWQAFRAAIAGERYGYTTPGKYAVLAQGKQVWMSDTDMEWRTNVEVMRRAHGRVIIFGLGMGFILHPILANPKVEHVTVVELNHDVINLIEPEVRKWKGGRRKLTIVGGVDARTLDPRKEYPSYRWNTIYFDIWPTTSPDNWPEMKKLKARWRKALDSRDEESWIGCWREWDCQRMASEDRKMDRIFARGKLG